MPFTRRNHLRILLAAVTSAILVGTLLTLATPVANAATIDTNAWYVLVNRTSGKALDVYNLATNDGARI
ncbi:RICIN domain-containing protein, partial [Streptosporangium sp. NPDC002607]